MDNFKTPEEIISENKYQNDSAQQSTDNSNMVRNIISDARTFFITLFTNLTGKILSNKFDVEVKNQIKFPEKQIVSGEVSVKDIDILASALKEIIITLDEVKKSQENAIKGIDIPSPLKEVSVTNLIDTKQELVDIKSEIKKLKLDPKIEVKSPEVTIDLSEIKTRLEDLVRAVQTKETESTGFSFIRNKDDELTTITEIYPNGNVISTGWEKGRVEVHDNRRS